MHVFLEAGAGNILAFFEIPRAAPMERDPNTPDRVQHIAFKVDSVGRLEEIKRTLVGKGVEVIGLTNHTLFQSIYFFDPNGHRIELAAGVSGSADLARLDSVKWDMLAEWSTTKRAPKHAAWMHEKEFSH